MLMLFFHNTFILSMYSETDHRHTLMLTNGRNCQIIYMIFSIENHYHTLGEIKQLLVLSNFVVGGHSMHISAPCPHLM